MSKGEKRALQAVLADAAESTFTTWRARAFDLAREAIDEAKTGHERAEIFAWLEEVVKLLEKRTSSSPADSQTAEVFFSPGDACRGRIATLLGRARKSAQICVFTITDDRLAQPILEAHKRGVTVQIITDNDKAHDKGSDAAKLRDAGVPVRVDRSEHHMHHKYAIFDGDTLLTGSYNWTRSAARYNRENIVVSDDPRLVAPFAESFRQTWSDLGSD